MSQIRPAASTSRADDGPAAIPVGDAVLAVLDVAFRARRAVLLEGPTGVGKSQIVEQFCAARGLQCRILDLSLLEPPDLVGLPVIRDGRTHYAPPAELPDGGEGVLLLEELNRAELPVMQPALQLLSARRLHTWELPAGWICAAAINPEGEDYDVRRLDPALRSRFLQVRVRADREAWQRWATRADLHPAVLRVVDSHPTVFQTSSPRSWAYLSDTWSAVDPGELRDPALRLALARGFLPLPWAKLACAALDERAPLAAVSDAVLRGPGGPAAVEAEAASLRAGGRTDGLYALAWRLRRVLRGWTGDLGGAGDLVAALPGDLRQRCLDALPGAR